MAQVVLRNVSKKFHTARTALANIDIEVADGELFVLLGPSGSGKSTLLRLIAGLELPSAGEIWIDQRRADVLAPRDRNLAMVFQNPALFPHLSVFENLAFGLRAQGVAQGEIAIAVRRTAQQLGLSELLDRSPQTLSGGERQRVALGRAIARRPAVYLFDEPFSSLDAPLRVALRGELARLHQELRATMLHVTHDQAEAMALGDRIAVMDRGRIVQVGIPRDVYDRPATRFVAQFLGSPAINVLPCAIDWANGVVCIRPIDGPDDARWTWNGPPPTWAGSRHTIDLGVRPERICVGGNPAPWQAIVEVRRLEPHGHETIAELAFGVHRLFARLPARTGVRAGERLCASFDPSGLLAFDVESGQVVA